jgi:FkbM family methyltransferase
MRLSSLVGATGRVVAFEPVPANFAILSSNVACSPNSNVTLLNLAVSDCSSVVGMTVPEFSTGLANNYMASIAEDASDVQALTVSVDSIALPSRVSFAKLDVEGHELPALQGMRRLIERDHPTLLVEGQSSQIHEFLSEFGYSARDFPDSPNRLFLYSREAA